jgi:hypothetical protein
MGVKRGQLVEFTDRALHLRRTGTATARSMPLDGGLGNDEMVSYARVSCGFSYSGACLPISACMSSRARAQSSEVGRMLFTLLRAFLSGDSSALSRADFLSLTMSDKWLHRMRASARAEV